MKVIFKQPTPYWYDAFFGSRGHILPRHLFAPYAGQDARTVPYNLKPVGTGPYQIVTFNPGDVALFEINRRYHVPNRPFFDSVELKGGGDATSAARAIIQTGEFDFAWNLQVETDVLAHLARQGERGKIISILAQASSISSSIEATHGWRSTANAAIPMPPIPS